MSAAGRGAINIRIAAALLMAQGAVACFDPWPDPPPAPTPTPPSSTPDYYLVVIPSELDVHVENPSNPITVRLVGKVFNRWRHPLEAEPLTFSMPPVTGLTLSSINTAGDTAELVIEATGTPTDQSITVHVEHATSSLKYDIPVRVMYGPKSANGVSHAPPASMYPAAGLASGEAGGGWKPNLLRAFVTRTQFETFNGNTAPPNEVTSGTVLSPFRTVWRREDPWIAPTADMEVPGTTESNPAIISVVPVHLAVDTPGPDGSLPSNNFLIDLQAGADIIENLLVGARVDIATPVEVPGNKVTWDSKCDNLEPLVFGLANPKLRPDPLRLMVYMVDRSGTGDKPMTCVMDQFPTYPESQAIFLPVGGVETTSVAHEFVHALSLRDHVVGLDYMDNNLMSVPVGGLERLRDRLTVGQTFRAALHTKSWIVKAGRGASFGHDCTGTDFLKCPLPAADISVRVP